MNLYVLVAEIVSVFFIGCVIYLAMLVGFVNMLTGWWELNLN